jgi:multicomponent Na+:H+ antiporter subunit C
MVIADLLGRLPYALILALASAGIALAAGAGNLLKRVAGLVLLWGALALFYALAGVLAGGEAPILAPGATGYAQAYSNPLPQALILGAIVAGAASIALALAVVVRIREAYGQVEAADIAAADAAQAQDEAGAS